jgi:hypothetical protein
MNDVEIERARIVVWLTKIAQIEGRYHNHDEETALNSAARCIGSLEHLRPELLNSDEYKMAGVNE